MFITKIAPRGTSLKVALYCFCVSLPFLVASALLVHPSSDITIESLSRGFHSGMNGTGIALAVIGFGALPFHFGWSFGAAFVVAAAVTAILTVVTFIRDDDASVTKKMREDDPAD